MRKELLGKLEEYHQELSEKFVDEIEENKTYFTRQLCNTLELYLRLKPTLEKDHLPILQKMIDLYSDVIGDESTERFKSIFGGSS